MDVVYLGIWYFYNETSISEVYITVKYHYVDAMNWEYPSKLTEEERKILLKMFEEVRPKLDKNKFEMPIICGTKEPKWAQNFVYLQWKNNK